MPLPLYGERELRLIQVMTSYSIHEGNVSLTPMGVFAPPTPLILVGRTAPPYIFYTSNDRENWSDN
jgi:hypothetical protein